MQGLNLTNNNNLIGIFIAFIYKFYNFKEKNCL